MDVTSIPFNTFLGIKKSKAQDGALLELQDSENYLNHVNTVHASVQFALGEASSGECLLQRFHALAKENTLLPVVRKVEVKYKKPAQGKIQAFAHIDDELVSRTMESLEKKGRAIIPVTVTVKDNAEQITMTATYEWFVQKIT